ncbi:CRISPR-associated protein Csy2 [compost metagenome]
MLPNGWIVPIPVGYGALAPVQDAGSVANGRDADTPVRFVESLYSIGQWLSPHRLRDVDDLLWCASADADAGLYRCHNHYARSLSADDKE